MSVSKGENELAQEETQVPLIDMVKTEYEIIDANYDLTVEYRYISADKKTEKWYFSYLPFIDGLTRTSDKPRSAILVYQEGESCDIMEAHVHGYYNLSEGYIMPFESEENELNALGCDWRKTKLVMKIAPEVCKVLHDFHLYRVSDNLIFLEDDLQYIHEKGYYGLIYLIPRKIEGDRFELDGVANTDVVAEYNASMNGFLFSFDYAVYEEEPTTEDLLHFILTKQ